jgi:WD40 repeat protein
VTIELDLETPGTDVSKVTVAPLAAKAIHAPNDGTLASSFVINTGEGLVWTMGWSPVNGDTDTSLLAVGCHPPGSSDSLHELTELCTKKDAVIQIWKVRGMGSDAKVEPLVNVLHEGGVTWSVCWCPSPRAAEGRLGLLAAVLGDGSVCVWDIPDLPNNNPSKDGVLTCRVAPVAELPPDHVDGSIPCTVDWLPHAPHDLLLVGYRDGCVSIVDLTDGNSPGERMRVKQYFPAEALTLTAARWFPAPASATKADRDGDRDGDRDRDRDGDRDGDRAAERRIFVTCGHESVVNVWDARLEYTPRLSIKTMCAYTIQDMTFTTSPLGIALALEDSSVRGLLMGADAIEPQLKSGRPLSMITFRGALLGSLWAVDAGAPSNLSPESQQSVAYAGEDGIIGIMGNASYPYLAKKRKDADRALLRLEVSGDSESAFRLSSGGKIASGTLYVDKSKSSKDRADKDTIPNAAHTIYSMRWSKECAGCQGRGQWLAYGNASGIVHIVWVKPPDDAELTEDDNDAAAAAAGDDDNGAS